MQGIKEWKEKKKLWKLKTENGKKKEEIHMWYSCAMCKHNQSKGHKQSVVQTRYVKTMKRNIK